METLMCPNWNKLSAGAFFSCMLMSVWIAQTPSAGVSVNVLPSMHLEAQKAQAGELLDRSPTSLDGSVESHARKFVFQVLVDQLPERYQEMAPRIAQTLIVEANRNGLDPI